MSNFDSYYDPPCEYCEVCGEEVDRCDCPECPVCHEVGNPKCAINKEIMEAQ